MTRFVNTTRSAWLLATLTLAVAAAAAPPGAAAPQAAQPALFVFRVGFWTNLHHQLHALTRPRPAAPLALPDGLPGAAREGWARALAHYRTLGRRSLLFDEGLIQLGTHLAALSDDELPSASAVTASTRTALLDARPAYAAGWAAQQRAARAFEARVAPLLDRHGAALARQVAAAYGTSWPEVPISVDLVADAGPPGNAYTLSQPARITVAVDDPRHQDLAALEMLFHEASHVWDVVLLDGLREAGRREGRVVRPDLWHGVLFFTAGELTRRELARVGLTYTPYAEVQGMTSGVYRDVWRAIVDAWTPYLDGRRAMTDSLTALVRAVGTLPPG